MRDLEAEIIRLGQTRLQPVINGTGIVLHTNFGRAPLGPTRSARRGDRGGLQQSRIRSRERRTRQTRRLSRKRCLALACGSEAATVVNNGAAALVLIVRHFTKQKPRSDHFPRRTGADRRRISGRRNAGSERRAPARSRRDQQDRRCDDYAQAIGPETGLILRVHQSNFFISGFTEAPPNEAIATLARTGAFRSSSISGAARSRRRKRSVSRTRTDAQRNPQAGRRSGLFQRRQVARRTAGRDHRRQNASRRGLETRAALSRFALRQDGFRRARSDDRISPAQAIGEDSGAHLLRLPNDELRARGEKLIEQLRGLPLRPRLVASKARDWRRRVAAFGHSFGCPRDFVSSSHSPNELATLLRQLARRSSVIVAQGRFKLDLRTIFPEQDELVVAALTHA